MTSGNDRVGKKMVLKSGKRVMTRRALIRVAGGGLLGVAGGAVLAACGETETVTREVIKDGHALRSSRKSLVETVVTREVIKEVLVETVVTRDVIKKVVKEVPVHGDGPEPTPRTVTVEVMVPKSRW